ncbi:MAG TPA: hypothetical protein VGI03_03200 [Verrucomicrobiae bacterium]
MRGFTFFPVVVSAVVVLGGFLVSARGDVNVTQHHNDYMRDGLYIDPAFTYSSASNLTRDVNFNGTVDGNIFAQPLYLDNGPGGRAMVIAVTESNNVYALDAASGAIIWQDHLGVPVPTSKLPCGDVNPLGITGTPVVDLTNNTLYVNAMITPDGGTTTFDLIYALNVDTGATNTGWPVNVDMKAQFDGMSFTSKTQQQRGALAVFDGYVYVPYGGLYGDCGTYHGWLVGVQESNPANVLAWATSANGGGAWGVGGVSSDDGVHPYFATGNTFNVSTWGGGDAVIRFQPGPVFSGLTNDYWAPTNWVALDNSDLDLGDCGPLIVNVPGATPSELAVAVGKDGYAYLLNRTNLSGITPPVAKLHFGSSPLPQAVAAYQTLLGTYIVCRSGTTSLDAFQITAANPPALVSAWTVSENGDGSPFVTSTDGTNDTIVWLVGSEGDQKLHGYNGQTGAVIFNGGGANELMANTRRFNTGIAARGRIYIANDNKVYAFTVPVPPINLTQSTVLPDGVFQLSFTNTSGMGFMVYGTTNLFLSLTNWTPLGAATEISPGQFQFTDPSPINYERFYRVSSQ